MRNKNINEIFDYITEDMKKLNEIESFTLMQNVKDGWPPVLVINNKINIHGEEEIKDFLINIIESK